MKKKTAHYAQLEQMSSKMWSGCIVLEKDATWWSVLELENMINAFNLFLYYAANCNN